MHAPIEVCTMQCLDFGKIRGRNKTKVYASKAKLEPLKVILALRVCHQITKSNPDDVLVGFSINVNQKILKMRL